ncbi:dormancy-associated protein 4 [Capsicum annuum]
MGFLHKLWDDTLAGPTPESGLGKLRKYNSFSGRSSCSAPSSPTTNRGLHHQHQHQHQHGPGGGAATDDVMPVSRSITILRSNSMSVRSGNTTPDYGSAQSSPAFSSACTSPFSPSTPRRNYKKQQKAKANMEPSANYDWIVLSSWDR